MNSFGFGGGFGVFLLTGELFGDGVILVVLFVIVFISVLFGLVVSLIELVVVLFIILLLLLLSEYVIVLIIRRNNSEDLIYFEFCWELFCINMYIVDYSMGNVTELEGKCFFILGVKWCGLFVFRLLYW